MTVVVVAGIGAVPAQAAPEGTPDDLYAVSTDLAHGDFAGDTAARDEVLSRVGQSDQLDDILAANVPATLDLSDLDADVQNATWVGQDQALEDAFRGLPETDERTGEVTLRASDNQREFSIAPLGSSRGNDEGGAVVTSKVNSPRPIGDEDSCAAVEAVFKILCAVWLDWRLGVWKRVIGSRVLACL